MKINIGQKEIIHFVGLGGIGMSGLAQIMKVMGFKVQGSDIGMNRNIENCKKQGIKFFLGQKINPKCINQILKFRKKNSSYATYPTLP